MPNGNQPHGFDPDLASQLERQPAPGVPGGFDPDLAAQLETAPPAEEGGGVLDFLNTQIEPLQRLKQGLLGATEPETAKDVARSLGLSESAISFLDLPRQMTLGSIPTTPLDLGLEALGTGAVGRGIRLAGQGLRAGARGVGRVAGLLPAPSAPAARAGETIRLGRTADLGQQVGRAVSGTEPLPPLGRGAAPGPVVAEAPRPQALGQPRLIKPTGKFFRELSPEQQSRLLERRERWFQDLAKGGVTDPPMSLVHAMDQLGTRYEQAQDATLALKGLAKGSLEGKDYQQWNDIARNLGKQLSRTKGLAKAGKVTSAENLAKSTAKALDEAGKVSTELLMQVGLAAGGAVAAGSQGESVDEQLKLAALGALGGAAAPRALRGTARGVRAVGRAVRKIPAEEALFFNALSSPRTMAKANLGGVGGVLSKATELIEEGAWGIDMRPIVQGKKMLQRLLTHGPRIYARGLRNPETVAPILADAGILPRNIGKGFVGRTIGRVYNAGDAVALDAMRAGGVSADEALRLTLRGEPTSASGQVARALLDPERGSQLLRSAAERGGIKAGGVRIPLPSRVPAPLAAAQRLLSLFPNVAIQSLERGLERTPLGLLRRNVPLRRRLAQMGPLRGAALGAATADEPEDIPGAALQGALLGPGITLGRELAGKISPGAVPLAGAFTGPNVLPFTLGLGTELARRSGESPVGAILEAFGETVPLGGQITQPFFDPSALARRFVPGPSGDIARARDPAFGRETGRARLAEEGFPFPLSELGGALANIPGVREQLPERFIPVTAFGERRAPEQGAAGRFFAPVQRRFMEPVADVTDPDVIAARELGINLSAPQGTFSVKGFDVPLERDTRLALQQARGQATLQAIRLISQNFPQLRSIPNSPLKTQLMQRLVSRLRDEILGQQEAGIVMRGQPEAIRQLPQTIREPER